MRLYRGAEGWHNIARHAMDVVIFATLVVVAVVAVVAYFLTHPKAMVDLVAGLVTSREQRYVEGHPQARRLRRVRGRRRFRNAASDEPRNSGPQ